MAYINQIPEKVVYKLGCDKVEYNLQENSIYINGVTIISKTDIKWYIGVFEDIIKLCDDAEKKTKI